MRGGNKDRTTGVLSLTNEEPLVVMETSVDIVRELIRDDGGDSRDGVVREGETPLGRRRSGSMCERSFGIEDRNVSRDR